MLLLLLCLAFDSDEPSFAASAFTASFTLLVLLCSYLILLVRSSCGVPKYLSRASRRSSRVLGVSVDWDSGGTDVSCFRRLVCGIVESVLRRRPLLRLLCASSADIEGDVSQLPSVVD